MKQTFILFASLLLAIALPHSAKAYNFSAVAPSGQTLYYNIVTGGVEVTSENGDWNSYTTYPTGALTIPSSVTYGGTTYAVTSIGDLAFFGCSGLTSVTIPDGVTSIGNSAFGGCSGLTSIAIPDGVTSIGNSAFGVCSGLTSIAIPDGVTSIGNGAFSSCSGLTSITIGSGVTSIGGSAFYHCIGLTSVTIPDGVTSIGEYAFYNCSGLTSVIIGSGVTSIGDYALCRCFNLTSVTIGSGDTSIGNYAFYGCSGLTSVTIGSGVTSIGGSAFSGCSGLHNIVCKAIYPPTAQSNTFEGVPAYCTLTVPCGSLPYYDVTEPWKSQFPLKDEDCRPEYTVTVLSANPTMGTVSGGGQVLEGDETTLTATANEGYRFDHWSDGSTQNPYSLAVTSDTVITAFFVAESVPCNAPTGLGYSDVTESSAVLNWTSTAAEWQLGIAKTSAPNDVRLVGVTTNPCTVSGLEANTSYDVRVRAICGAGDTSAWSTTATFTTQQTQGIDDVESGAVSLYPNPAGSTVTLTGIEGPATVTVADMNGRECGRWTTASGQLTIDVAGIARGTYFVRIVGDRQSVIRKLIVR